MDEDVRRRRLRAQRIDGPPFDSAPEAVRRLLAVQSQDLEPAAWSVAMRSHDVDEPAFFAHYDAGEVLRTHVLRPTWHFVHPDDIRWLLSVTAPRVHVLNGFMYRSTGLDPATLQRATDVIVAALDDGPQTRTELAERLAVEGIEASGQRLAYIVMHAELEQVVCSGPRHGKQLTYELLDRRAPPAAMFDLERALGELAVRFVAGHGPATPHDLAGWASLRIADARRGFEVAGDRLVRIEGRRRTYHALADDAQDEGSAVTADAQRRGSRAGARSSPSVSAPTVHLLQPYDEYVSGFPESRDVYGPSEPAADTRFYSAVIADGLHAGWWRRTIHRDRVVVEVALHEPLRGTLATAVTEAAGRYGAFSGRAVEVVDAGATPPA